MKAAILNSAMLDLTILHKKTSLIHSDSTWWWQPSSIWPSWIQPSLFYLSYSLKLAKNGSHHLHKKNLLTFPSQPFAQKIFTHSFWLNLMMVAILNSAMLNSAIWNKTLTLNSDTAILDSDTLLSSLRFTQKHSHSTLTLNQTNSIWLKLIPSQVNWWWQPSWILPSWIQLFCTKRNFTYFFWLNLIMAAILNSAILDSSIFEQNSDAN